MSKTEKEEKAPKLEEGSLIARFEKTIPMQTHVTFELGPGPPLFKMNRVVNWNKGMVPFYIFALMLHFQNFTPGMWVYLVLHGSYGFFWVFKDMVFPDKGFARKQTLSSAGLVWLVAGPYYVFGYLMVISTDSPHIERIVYACLVYFTGIVLMMGADG
jgi:hypothetical protein